MTTLVPNSQASGVEAYEDMFKEITKKLYGEEASQSLHTPMAHAALDVERSFTNLLSDRNVAQTTDFDHNAAGTAGGHIDNASTLKSDDHLTAFGLAALMQNGFATPNALLNSHTFQQMNKQNHHHGISSSAAHNISSPSNSIGSVAPVHNNPNESIQEKCSAMQQQHQHQQQQQQQQQQQPQQPHGNDLNAWNPKSDAYQHTSKHYKSKKHEATSHHISNEHLKSPNSLNSSNNQTANNGNNGNQSGLQKRYSCSNCPYSTDRRDLFTRHENIHKEDKPFHCYVCLKQFNRADHVKKHFLRMHRGLNYDIVRTKRSVPQANSTAQSTTNQSVTSPYHTSMQNSHHQQMETTAQTSSIIDQTNSHLSNAFNHATPSGNAVSNHQNPTQLNIKTEKRLDKSVKKNDKRFLCCYCSWSGNDNWGLKRHLNTHTKPFVCGLCDYKAARSERLATHVFKVHNKKVCTKCNYLAENQTEYDAHVNTTHANETRVQRSNQTESRSSPSSNNAVRNSVNSGFNGGNSFNTLPTTSASSSPGHTFGHWRSMIGGTGITSPGLSKSNGSNNSNQKRGAERLFQYFGADDSDPEDYARQLQMAAISRNTASVAQDFHNAGGGKIDESQTNANNQTNDSIIELNKQNDDNSTNKFGNIAFSSELDGDSTDNRCENVRSIYYNQSSSSSSSSPSPIVRQRISPPAKQIKQLNRLTNTVEYSSNCYNNDDKRINKLNLPNRLVERKHEFNYYLQQIRLNDYFPRNNVYLKLRKLL